MANKLTDAEITQIRNALGITYTQAMTLINKNPDKSAQQIISDAKLKQRDSSVTNHLLNKQNDKT